MLSITLFDLQNLAEKNRPCVPYVATVNIGWQQNSVVLHYLCMAVIINRLHPWGLAPPVLLSWSINRL